VSAVASTGEASSTTRVVVRQRVGRLLRTELLLAQRFNVVVATVVVSALWVAVLRVVPEAAREIVAPVVLLTDVTALGFLFVPALLVVERVEGVEAAMRLTPVRLVERVGVRLGVTTTLSVAAALAVCAAAGVADVAPRVLGVALLSVLFGLIAVGLTAGASTLTVFLTRAPFVAAPLIAPALAHLAGLTASPLLYISPVTSAVDMLRGDLDPVGLVWQLLWITATALIVGRVAHRLPSTTDPASTSDHGVERRTATWPVHRGRYATARAIHSFVRADRRSLVRDGLALMLIASVPLLALVMRLIATVGVNWVDRRYGVQLAPHLPVIEALLLVVHTPVIFGSLTGLLLLEDRDAQLFGPLQATRAGLATVLGYRLGATALATTAALLVSLPFDGVVHPSGAAGVTATAVAAGAASSVPALLMAATAGNRVQGVAVMKMLGLPLYLPLATWVLAGPARWIAAPVPTAWAMWASWAMTPLGALVAAGGAIAVSAAWAVPLARRVLRSTT
jgi:fluoroquinolone transport system permease protein